MSLILLRCTPHNRERKLPVRLWQVAQDDQAQRCARYLSKEGQTLVPEAWKRTPRPFAEGLYCRHCLEEGKSEPLGVEREDWDELGIGDKPVVFIDAKDFKLDAHLPLIRERFAGRIPEVLELPGRDARFDEELAPSLHPSLQEALERVLPSGASLYAFQAQAAREALAGRDTIVTTPTASGKSLSYWVPVLETLLREPGATALYLSPLVALTEDQLEAVSRFGEDYAAWGPRASELSIHRDCRTLSFGPEKLTIARYDGQVVEAHRSEIRKRNPRIVFTTPDMLHMGILGGAKKSWASFFAGLRYVIVDEFHTYRGLHGAGFANLMRRLTRLANQAGSSPQFLCASATLSDPAASVRQLIGREPVVIDALTAGAGQRKRAVVVLDSAAGGETRALATEAKNVLLHLLDRRVQSIAFSGSIAELNNITRILNADLAEKGKSELVVQSYAREHNAEDKRRLVQAVRQGRVHSIVSTSALSMGVDIGSLAASVIVGFPGSIAQFWQQAGRAGRSGEGMIVYIAGANPLDQFFVRHPERLSLLQAEPMFCNPDNPYVVRGHLMHAMREAPLSLSEARHFGPSAREQLSRLQEEGLASETPTGWVLADNPSPPLPPFRSIGYAVEAVEDVQGKKIADLDLGRAHRAYHKHAVVQVQDKFYRVVRQTLDHRAGRGQIRLLHVPRPDVLTKPVLSHAVTFLEARGERRIPGAEARYGLLRSDTRVDGYFAEPLHGHGEKAKYQGLGAAAPEPLSVETQGLWLTAPEGALGDWPPNEQAAGLASFAGALRLAIAVEELCDPSDLEAMSTPAHPQTQAPTVVVWDAIAGGVGLAQEAWQNLEAVVARALAILAECPHCSTEPESRGCPQCVTARYGDADAINRHVGMRIAQAWLDALLAEQGKAPEAVEAFYQPS